MFFRPRKQQSHVLTVQLPNTQFWKTTDVKQGGLYTPTRHNPNCCMISDYDLMSNSTIHEYWWIKSRKHRSTESNEAQLLQPKPFQKQVSLSWHFKMSLGTYFEAAPQLNFTYHTAIKTASTESVIKSHWKVCWLWNKDCFKKFFFIFLFLNINPWFDRP